ncbi:MAG: recombinase family protein, partial [Myxococcota bacterium]|nr:recombinase family protein [Myxococcota bacterium]
MTGKIKPLHLERQAYVYVRQSTPGQVREHVESKQRQYALAERAVALGWNRTAVEIVDEDQAKSGSSTQGRDGFARLAHEVAHGKVGAILALEVSRLARSSQDWQRLLSLCAVAHVVVIDEQTVYDPSHHDDKLLLDLKGAMSEQELHWLSLRLAGGRLNKARRGESYVTPPTGYVWGGRGLELDPDESVRRAVEAIFTRFAIEPSARAVLRWA